METTEENNTEIPSVEPNETPEVTLPSEQEEIDLSKFSLNNDLAQKYVKNGKIMGRFDNVEAVFSTLKSVEDKYAQLNREIKNGANTQDNQLSADDIIPFAQKFVENGMELTDELQAEIESKGIDVRDIKLTAIEIKEKVSKAFEIVGSKENYDAMIEWGRENLPKPKQNDFNQALQTGMGEYAIKGLWSDYQVWLSQNTQQPNNADRVRGDTTVQTQTSGYKTRNDMLRDHNAVRKATGLEKTKLEAQYKAKLAKTPDHIIYG